MLIGLELGLFCGAWPFRGIWRVGKSPLVKILGKGLGKFLLRGLDFFYSSSGAKTHNSSMVVL